MFVFQAQISYIFTLAYHFTICKTAHLHVCLIGQTLLAWVLAVYGAGRGRPAQYLKTYFVD